MFQYFVGVDEERHNVGVPVKATPTLLQPGKNKDDAYDQFMKEMENLL